MNAIPMAQRVNITNNSWQQTHLAPQEKQNLDLVLHFMNDGIGKADLAVFDECVATDAQIHTGLKVQGPIDGLSEYKAIFGPFAEAWPVHEFIIDEAFAVEDKVVIRFQALAHSFKDYYGIPASNAVINMKEVHVLTVREGKIVNNVVSGTNFPLEFLLYPVLKEAVIGNLPRYNGG